MIGRILRISIWFYGDIIRDLSLNPLIERRIESEIVFSWLIGETASGENVVLVSPMKQEIRNAPYMDRLVRIYKDIEDAYRVNLFVSQNNPSPSGTCSVSTHKENHVRDASIEKISDMDSYESPISDLGESECPTDVIDDSDIDEKTSGSIF